VTKINALNKQVTIVKVIWQK